MPRCIEGTSAPLRALMRWTKMRPWESQGERLTAMSRHIEPNTSTTAVSAARTQPLCV